ncbi:MAG: glycosyltransferase family 4 protein [Thermoanaerobaculales bacterium]
MSTGSILVWAGAGLVALALNVIGVAMFRRWAIARRVLDVPNWRSSHTVPTPRGAGVVLVMVAGLGTITGAAVGVVARERTMLWLGMAATAIVVVSGLEDVRRVPLGLRLGVQLAAGAVAVIGLTGPNLVAVPFLGRVNPGLVGGVLAVVWVVGLANAFNFMDGIDGIAGGQALVAALGWLLLADSGSGLQWVAMLLAAGSLGFLVFNWAPAKVFMGDIGAVFLGFTFAVLALVGGRAHPRMVFAGVLLVWPFLFDTAFTLARRIGRGENVVTAHRSHLYQRLVIAGYGHAEVSGLYVGLAVVGLGLAKLWVTGFAYAGAFVTVVISIAGLGLWWFTTAAEHASARRPPALPN